MEHRRRRRLALLLALLVVFVAGGLYVALNDVIVPRGPDRDEDLNPFGSGPRMPGTRPEGDAELDSRAADGTPPDDEGGKDAEGDDGRVAVDRETKWSLLVLVRDPEGKPVKADLIIEDERIGRSIPAFAPTDGTGHTRVFLRRPGSYRVTAVREGTRITQTVTIEGESISAVLTFDWPGDAVIHGTVRTEFGPLTPDIRGRETVPGQEPLSVDLVSVEDGESLASLVDEDGRFRIAGAAAGEYFLRVPSKWFVTRVTLGAEEDKAFDVVLPAGRIFGRVTDAATGKAPEGVQVVIGWSGPGGALTGDHEKAGFETVSDRCMPDENGDYAFSNLPPGAYRLFSNGHWYNVVSGEATLTDARMEARVDFALEKGSVVVLSVLDLEGNEVERPFCATQGIRWGFTGHVSGLKAGASDFIAGGDGYEFQRQVVDFKPGEATPAEFRLAKQAATRLIFVDPDGRPVAGVRVAVPWGNQDIQRLSGIFRRGTSLPLSETDAEGAVWIYGVRAGPCTVKARKDGYASFDESVKLPEGGGDVKVTLTPGDVTYDFRLVVVRLSPDGQAAKLGVKVGDVIRAVDGKAVKSRKELAAAIGAAKAAGKATIALTVEQGGREAEIEFATGPLGVSLEERFE